MVTVGIDGTVSDVTIPKGISPEQDKQFTEAIRNSRFQPGKLANIPVAVRMRFRMQVKADPAMPEFSFAPKSPTATRQLTHFDFGTPQTDKKTPSQN